MAAFQNSWRRWGGLVSEDKLIVRSPLREGGAGLHQPLGIGFNKVPPGKAFQPLCRDFLHSIIRASWP